MLKQHQDVFNKYAFNLYERVQTGFEQAGWALSDNDIAHLQRLAIVGPYAAEQIANKPEIYKDWLEYQSSSSVELSFSDINGLCWEGVGGKAVKQCLRQYRHRYLVWIILNDIALNLPVATILKQISDLSDALIQSALQAATHLLAKQHGMPLNAQGQEQELMVMAMGKLGGGELNFSSDVDLIYVYAEDGELSGRSALSYREFYIRVGRLLTQFLNEITADGFVYRVDLRLRPWGDSGPLVININGLEGYYHLHGRDWERYALVKARILTGTDEDKAALQAIITPFVYRKYHDFNVFSGLGRLKQQIDVEARQKNKQHNIKLCSGGIREVEFCMQALQILQGGRNQQFQVTSLLKMFELAAEVTFYSADDLLVLRESYEWYRIVENRIQMMNDQQTHDLPTDEESQQRLLVSLNCDSWEQLKQSLSVAQNKVHELFKSLFIEQESAEPVLDFSCYDRNDWQEYLADNGIYTEADQSKIMWQFFQERAILTMSKKGKDRLHELLPELLKLSFAKPDSEKLLLKVISLLLSIAKRSVYLELMSLYRPLLHKLVDLLSNSQWVAEEVIRYPILLESIFIAEESTLDDQGLLFALLDKKLKQAHGDEEMELDILRVFKRQQVFQIALKELDGKIDALQASEYLSELAALLLQASYVLNWERLVQQYGLPCYQLEGEQLEAQFGIVAYGKLGGRELHYTSDLDVIFLHNSKGEKQYTNGNKVIDNTQFFARLGQKIISTVGLLTSSGRLYEVDTRLRPNGMSGVLVSSLDAFKQYQVEKAWVWEHQALVRSNFVAGDARLSKQFQSIKCMVMKHERSADDVRKEVSQMREKMFQQNISKAKDRSVFNLKHSRGGLVDIEFMVQYFVLINSNKLSSLCKYSDNIALLEHLVEKKRLGIEYLALVEIYRKLHQQLHLQVLHDGYSIDLNQQLNDEIRVVKEFWQQNFECINE